MQLTEDASIEPAGTKLDSFAETKLILAGVTLYYLRGHDSNNLKKI